MKTPILLASSSERRRQLLELIQVPVSAYFSPDIDETPQKKELPRSLAQRLAEEKGRFAAEKYPDHIVISADSVVACGRRILDKAESNDDVQRYLKLLSGRRHCVYTALFVMHPTGKKSAKIVKTTVAFKCLTPFEIEDYIKTGEGIGKAGGYAIQGIASKYIRWIQGSYHAVMGLPVHEVYNTLSGI